LFNTNTKEGNVRCEVVEVGLHDTKLGVVEGGRKRSEERGKNYIDEAHG
jgi:hypothetical protein